MYILGMKEQSIKYLDTTLGRKIVISANFKISEQFNKEILMAIKLVEMEMIYQNIDIDRLKPTNFIFTNFGKIEIEMEAIGNHIQFCVIDYSKLEKITVQNARLCIMIEELVHRYWNYDDEMKIKYIDIEILKRLDSTVKIEDIFNLESILEEQKNQSLVLTPDYFNYMV